MQCALSAVKTVGAVLVLISVSAVLDGQGLIARDPCVKIHVENVSYV